MEEKLVWCRCGCLLAAKRQKMQLTVNTSLFANYKCATKLLSVAFESGLRLTVAFAGSSTETTGGYVTTVILLRISKLQLKMDSSSIESNSIEWNTEDELDVDNISSSSSHQDQIADFAPSSSSCNCRGSNTIHQFLQMGFSKEMVIKAVKENGQNEGAVLDALLAYKTFEESPEDEHVLDDPCHAELASNVLDVYPDKEICENEEFKNLSTEKDRTVSLLVEMGYQAEEALAAIDRCSLYSMFYLFDCFMSIYILPQEQNVGILDERIVLKNGTSE
ncbi:DNA (cytosine-5)-methyltransferase DRM2-like [Coffea eugenioides]|uniref:DNA (cytosine-5)-methyltransferase DRM2-like n=1 Tax=Coffea eugenioides TaxID=49369 RepID=UPI000F615604|nr:DNA (cytosine-5)-methyltransferase DRM2-like [Coffea eugenioides]